MFLFQMGETILIPPTTPIVSIGICIFFYFCYFWTIFYVHYIFNVQTGRIYSVLIHYILYGWVSKAPQKIIWPA